VPLFGGSIPCALEKPGGKRTLWLWIVADAGSTLFHASIGGFRHVE
jgi:hypothetical protein